METETQVNVVPLSEDEQRIWDRLVERGKELSAPRLAAREARRLANRQKMADGRNRSAEGWKTKSRERVVPIPDGVKRFIVARACGMKFSLAASTSGCKWIDVEETRTHSDEVMAAVEAMEECVRDLMKAKAMSVVETSMDEGARPNFVQLQMASKILAGLDREHFGEDRGYRRSEDEDEKKELGSGGFVIKVIGDAAQACSKPVEKTGRALVYTDV